MAVLGAIVLRTVMIFARAWLITQFHWILYFSARSSSSPGSRCGGFADEKPDLEQNPVVKWLRGHMNITSELHGRAVFVFREQAGNWSAMSNAALRRPGDGRDH